MLNQMQIENIEWANEEFTRWEDGVDHQGSIVSKCYFRLWPEINISIHLNPKWKDGGLLCLNHYRNGTILQWSGEFTKEKAVYRISSILDQMASNLLLSLKGTK